ncbi:M1 family metallopeptidase [Flavihumibacter petaseus]|nr:M1 family metallopeptidase [Flavihumibacter petaseus]
MQLTSLKTVILTAIGAALACTHLHAQPLSKRETLTHQDTLRGSLNPERAWWDVQRYDITVTPDYTAKTISGEVDLSFKVVRNSGAMQIDLQEPMMLNKAVLNGKNISIAREGNAWHLAVPGDLNQESDQVIRLTFSGKPREAIRAPWDGGWIWTKDRAGNPWMSVACQGLGASVWYPCKDHQSDEPDKGATLSMIVSKDLVAVANGRLKEKKDRDSKTVQYTWEVKNPINNYDIIPYIGKYTSWNETFQGEKGNLDLQFWVLQEDLEAAKQQFIQVKPMLQCFEHWFGPYPFYEDGYKLVQAPHLGMEHQSAVAYGNKFKNGYLGRDLSGTGWGLKWDFIIIHESGHEWFGNNITSKDIADMWVHEGFTNYSETIYTECQDGLEAANAYIAGVRKNIRNDIPIIGIYGVNKEGSGDMYPKAANMIHYIRQLMKDDEKFRQLLRNLNSTYYHRTTTSSEVEAFISRAVGRDLSPLFEQYLRTTKVPVLQYGNSSGVLSYRWKNVVPGFNLPVKVKINGKETWLEPTEEWQTLKVMLQTFEVDPNFYVETKKQD